MGCDEWEGGIQFFLLATKQEHVPAQMYLPLLSRVRHAT